MTKRDLLMKKSLITSALLAISFTISPMASVLAEPIGPLLSDNKQVIPYLPKDVKLTEGASFRCDENGKTTKIASVHGRCMNYSSAGTATSWRVRYIYEGQAERVFKYTKNRNREILTPWVTFDPDDSDVYGPPLFVSAGAKQQFVSNRDPSGTNGAKASTNSSTPSIESESRPVTTVDCSRLDSYSKIACEAGNASTQEAIKSLPIPQTVTAPDCSGLGPFAKIACEAANAAAIEALKSPSR
jgi:hypothetical protein